MQFEGNPMWSGRDYLFVWPMTDWLQETYLKIVIY